MGLLPPTMKGPCLVVFYASHQTSLMPNPFVPAFDQTEKQSCPHSGVPEALQFMFAGVTVGTLVTHWLGLYMTLLDFFPFVQLKN